MELFLFIVLIILVAYLISEVINNLEQIKQTVENIVAFFVIIFVVVLIVKACSSSNNSEVNIGFEQNRMDSMACTPTAVPLNEDIADLNLDQYQDIPEGLTIDVRFAYLESMMNDVQTYMNSSFHLTNESIRGYHNQLMKGFSEEKSMLDGIKQSLEDEREKLQNERDNQLIGNLKMVYMGAIAGWLFSVLLPSDLLSKTRRKITSRHFKKYPQGMSLISTYEIQVLGQYYRLFDLDFCTKNTKLMQNLADKGTNVLIVLVFFTLLMIALEYLFLYLR